MARSLPASQCAGPELFASYGSPGAAVAELRPGQTRTGCRCVRTVDIGMDDTCVAGCTYCYAVEDHQAAIARYRRHDPGQLTLR